MCHHNTLAAHACSQQAVFIQRWCPNRYCPSSSLASFSIAGTKSHAEFCQAVEAEPERLTNLLRAETGGAC